MARRLPNASLMARLPKHYLKFREELKKPSARVHDVAEKMDLMDYRMKDPKTLWVERVPDVPITVEYPAEADMGLWGGEGLIKGFLKNKQQWALPYPRMWFANLKRTVVYSEVLDKYISVVVTRRTLRLIDQAAGFDNYILRTPVQDLKSQLGLDLRRLMLIALAKKDFHKDNPQMHEIVWEKYKDCALPLEEAEWFGLRVEHALRKQAEIDAEKSKPIPLKVVYTQQLLQRLSEMKARGELPEIESESKPSVVSKILPKSWFKKSSEKQSDD